MNALLWGVALLIIAAGLWGNHFYQEISLPIRAIGLVGVFIVALFCAALTTHGKKFIRFVQEARTELRKIVWPTRQETMQMSGIVLFVVSVVGIFLWGVDAILLKVVGWLTGLGA